MKQPFPKMERERKIEGERERERQRNAVDEGRKKKAGNEVFLFGRKSIVLSKGNGAGGGVIDDSSV